MDMPSKRSIEKRFEDLEDDVADQDNLLVAHRDPVTGNLETDNGSPVTPDEHSGLIVIIERSIVMTREQAEQADREILGPVEDAAEDVDAVEVVPEI